jgi:hypothetical protein
MREENLFCLTAHIFVMCYSSFSLPEGCYLFIVDNEAVAAKVIIVQLSQISNITIIWDLMLFTDVSHEIVVSICFSFPTLKMAALISFRMSVNSYQTTQNNFADALNLYIHCCILLSISYT